MSINNTDNYLSISIKTIAARRPLAENFFARMGVKVMPFQKGETGNSAGRPKLTDAQKDERERFKALLKSATLPALESVIAIACDEKHRDRFKACQLIINKAYGENTAFLDDEIGNEPITINIVRRSATQRVQDEDDSWD